MHFDRLLKEVQKIAREVCGRDVHTVQEVLVEEINEHDPSLVSGRLSNNTVVHFPGDASMIGTLRRCIWRRAKASTTWEAMVTEEKLSGIITNDAALYCRQKRNIRTVFYFTVWVIFMKCFSMTRFWRPGNWN